MRRMLLGALMLCLFCLAPAVSRAQEVGTAASQAPHDWPVPPGHFGLLASYGDAFLSVGPFGVSWPVLVDSTDDPTKADQLSDFVVLDVRTPAVFDSRLAGAQRVLQIPYAQVVKRLAELPTDQPILVVCQTGLMSGEVGTILGMLGYDVRILVGGMKSVQ